MREEFMACQALVSSPSMWLADLACLLFLQLGGPQIPHEAQLPWNMLDAHKYETVAVTRPGGPNGWSDGGGLCQIICIQYTMIDALILSKIEKVKKGVKVCEVSKLKIQGMKRIKIGI